MNDHYLNSWKFWGSKVALIYGQQLVVLRKDDIPGLHSAGMWDLPGGRSEAGESPIQCLVRETKEEVGLDIEGYPIEWMREYPSSSACDQSEYFMVVKISKRDTEKMTLGDEGQDLQLMTLSKFVSLDNAITHLVVGVQDYLNDMNHLRNRSVCLK